MRLIWPLWLGPASIGLQRLGHRRLRPERLNRRRSLHRPDLHRRDRLGGSNRFHIRGLGHLRGGLRETL